MRLKMYRGTWCAVWNDGTTTRRTSLRTKDRADADIRFQNYLKESAVQAKTVAEIFKAYEDDKVGTPSHSGLPFVWKAVGPHFGNLLPDQLDRKTSREYISNRRAAGVSDGTIHRELGMLRAAIRWHNPNTSAIIELPAKPDPKDRYLSREEYAALLKSAVSPHVRLFIILALATAGRAGAVLDMTWDQVDFDRGIIRLSKGKETRLKGRATVPMTSLAREALLQGYEARETNYVIEWAGEPVKAIKMAFRRTATRAGLKGVTPHVLRHTAAVWMAEAGTPMSEIAQYLGHRTTAITERVYARYSPEYLKGAAKALEVHL